MLAAHGAATGQAAPISSVASSWRERPVRHKALTSRNFAPNSHPKHVRLESEVGRRPAADALSQAPAQRSDSQTAMSPAEGIRPVDTTLPSMTRPGVLMTPPPTARWDQLALVAPVFSSPDAVSWSFDRSRYDWALPTCVVRAPIVWLIVSRALSL